MGAGGDRSITSVGTELLRRRVVGPRPSTEPERAGGGAEDRRRRRVLRRTGKETDRLDFQNLSAYREKEAAQLWERAGPFCLLWLIFFPFFFALILMMSLLYLFCIKKLLHRFSKKKLL